MLYIDASYHFMQFCAKPMNQTRENAKKPTSKCPLKTTIILGVVYLPSLKDHHHVTPHGLSLAKLNSFPDHSLELKASIRILWHI